MSRRQKPAIDSSIPPADLPLRPSVRFRLAKNDTFFGPGVAEFLILVDQSNSMQTACKEMEMSYSKGWKIIKKAENYLGYSLIESKSGGASGGFSHLTPEAKELLTRYQGMEKELKAVTTLAACAMFAALAMILNQVASIDIGPYVRIGFSGIPNRLVDYLFGPVTGCLFSGILDVVKYFLKPSGPFFFGFTFNAMLASFMYGCFYYRKKLTIKRVLAAKFIVMLTVNVLLNTLWISMLYGKGIMVLLPARALKNLIMWPIDSIIFYSLTKLIEQTGVFRMFHARTAAQAQR